MSWLILIFAGLFEIAWALGLKMLPGTDRPLLWIGVLICIAASMIMLALAMREIPVGTAYAVWTGIGILGTFIGGIILFSEPVTTARIIAAIFVLAGVLMFKLTTG